jgi:PhnB protein
VPTKSHRSNFKSTFKPKGWPTVIPRLVANDAQGLVKFVKRVFKATGRYRNQAPSQIAIGDSLLMITETGIRRRITSFFYVYVPDTDATYRRAIVAGARKVEAPTLTSYGDRRCIVKDKWGNTWQIATHLGSFTAH